MAVTIRCSACRKKMRWDTDEQWPSFCPLCGIEMGNARDDDDIVTPFVRASQISKAHDKVYRDMEAASERRVEDVAAMTGTPAAELSHMKITDLRPTTTPGSIAAPPLPAHLQAYGGFQASGNEWAAAVRSGPEPNAGARTLHRMQRMLGKA